MTLSSDLTGLGVPPLQAERTSSGGIGPISVTATGTNFATGYPIKNAQYFIYMSSGNGSGTLALPPVGGDNGALIGDNFVIINGSSLVVSIYPPSTVSIIGAGSNNSAGTPITVASNAVITIWAGPTTTTWIYK